MTSLCGCISISERNYYIDKYLLHPDGHSSFRESVRKHLEENPMCRIRAECDKVWRYREPREDAIVRVDDSEIQ